MVQSAKQQIYSFCKVNVETAYQNTDGFTIEWSIHIDRSTFLISAKYISIALIALSSKQRVGLLVAKTWVHIPGQSSKMKYEKYLFGDYLSADFWQKL